MILADEQHQIRLNLDDGVYSTETGETFPIVLDNDIDLDGDTLTTFLVQTTPNGTLTLLDNG